MFKSARAYFGNPANFLRSTRKSFFSCRLMSVQVVFDKYSEAVCGFEKLSRWAEILESGKQFHDSKLIQLLEAKYWASYGDMSKAVSCVDKAAKLKPKNKGEILYQRAFECFILKGAYAESADFFRQILEINARDMFAMKMAMLMSFCCGDTNSMLLAARPKDNTVLRTLPYYHGMLAFALEENGELKAAEEVCEEGLKLFPKDPWTHHCLSHIYYFEGRINEGIKRLLVFSNHWDDLNVFLRCHLWWHIALLYLEKHDYTAALKVAQDKCWESSGDKNDIEVHIGVLGFIWKFELYSKTTQNQLYSDVVSVILEKDPAPGYLLFDLLYLRALLRVGKDMEAENYSTKMVSEVTKVYACGLMALAKSDSKGLTMLEEGLGNVNKFMASVEQSLVFHEHYVCECIRLGETERAKRCIDELLKLRESEIWRGWRTTVEQKL